MTAERIEDLIGVLGAELMERGAADYREGLVHAAVIHKDGIRAKVRERSGFGYPVMIPMESEAGEGPADSIFCLCQDSPACRHVAALLFALIESQAGALTIPEETPARGGKPGRPSAKRSEVWPDAAHARGRAAMRVLKDLKQSGGRLVRSVLLHPENPADCDGNSPIAQMFKPAPPPSGASDTRWALVFMVFAWGDGNRDPVELEIRPAVQLVKKRGGHGRIEAYRPGMVTEKTNAPSLTLLRKLEVTGLRSPLQLHWDYLQENPGIGLYGTGVSPRDGKPRQILRTRAREVAIDFSASTDPMANLPTVSLAPILRFDTEDGAFACAAGSKMTAAVGGDLILFKIGEEALISFETRWELCGLLAYLAKPGTRLTIDELAQLRAGLEAADASGIRVSFRHDRFRLVSAIPGVSLVVSRPPAARLPAP